MACNAPLKSVHKTHKCGVDEFLMWRIAVNIAKYSPAVDDEL